MRVEYGVHNAEEWGGFVSIREEAPIVPGIGQIIILYHLITLIQLPQIKQVELN